MIKKVFGVIFVLSAFSSLTNSGTPFEKAAVFLICLAIGLYLLLGKEKIRELLDKTPTDGTADKIIPHKNRKGIDILSRSNLIVLDTETTGLSETRDEILQLSIIDGNGNVLFDSLIKPLKRKTWKDAEQINGISPQMVQNCPTIDDVAGEVQDILRNADAVAGYNVEFDIKFLEAAGFRVSVPHYDLMKDFAPVHGVWHFRYNDWRYPKLTDCARYFGYSFNAHNSLEDAKATLFCMHKLDELKQSGEYDRIVRENYRNR